MFLTQGPLFNEPVWRAFFEAAQRLHVRVEPELPGPVDLLKVVKGGLKPPLARLPEDQYVSFRNTRPRLLFVERRHLPGEGTGRWPAGQGGWESEGDIVRSANKSCRQETPALLEKEVNRLMAGGKGSVWCVGVHAGIFIVRPVVRCFLDPISKETRLSVKIHH